MAGNACAAPSTTYIQNTAYGTAACVPTSAAYYTTVKYSSLGSPDGVSSLCNKNCNADSQRCKAYVANAGYIVTGDYWTVGCYLMTTQAPSPTNTCNQGLQLTTSVSVARRDGSPSITALTQGLQNVDSALTNAANVVGGAVSNPLTLVAAIPNILASVVDLTTAVAAVPIPAVGSLLELSSADQTTLCALTKKVGGSVENLVTALQLLVNRAPVVGAPLNTALSTVQTVVTGLINAISAGGLTCGQVLPTIPVTLPTIPVTLPSIPLTLPTLPLTSPTIPVISPTTPSTSLPLTTPPKVFADVKYAAYRDDVNSCFSQSVTAAVRYCSFLLSKAPPSTKYIYTSTTTPTKSKTITKISTTSVCSVKKAARDGAEDFPEPTPELEPEAAQADAKREPVPFGNVPRATPVAAPAPACLQPKVYPGLNSVSACSCLASVTALTSKTVSTAPAVTKTVTKTSVKSVQKTSVPTFRPKASFAGPASSGGGAFTIMSRVVSDAKRKSQRILLYARPNGPTPDPAALHISTPKSSPSAPNKLFGVTVENNNLKANGMVAFSTSSAKGAVNVLGELPAGASSKQQFKSCTTPNASNGPVTCKLSNGDAAVFYEVAIPGQKGKYAIGVAAKTAPKGTKVLTLQASAFGNVIVGCGKK